jgi:mannosyltransferase
LAGRLRVTIVLAGICLIYAALRLYHLSAFAMWHDEVFSVVVARMSWGAMFHAVIADLVHPPLFYILLKTWIALGGQSLFWMRLLPYLFSIGTILPLLALLKQLPLPGQAGIAALLLVTFNPPLIRYSQELRMYSLLVLLSVISLWLFVRFLHSGKQTLWPLFVVNLLLAYSHYYGMLFLVSEAIVVLLWSCRSPFPERYTQARRFVFSLVLVGIAFLPWAYTVGRAASEAGAVVHARLGWIEVPRFADVTWFYGMLNGALPLQNTTAVGLVLFLLPVLVALFGPRRQEVIGLAVFAFFPTSVGVLVSHLLPLSVFGPRYLIGCAIPYLLMITVAVFSIPRYRLVLASLIVGWSMLAGLYYIQRPDRRIAWDVVANRIHSFNAPVYTAEEHEGLPLSYYGVKNTVLTEQSDLQKLQDSRFVLVYRDNSWRGEKPESILQKRGYTVAELASERDWQETIVIAYVEKRAP